MPTEKNEIQGEKGTLETRRVKETKGRGGQMEAQDDKRFRLDMYKEEIDLQKRQRLTQKQTGTLSGRSNCATWKQGRGGEGEREGEGEEEEEEERKGKGKARECMETEDGWRTIGESKDTYLLLLVWMLVRLIVTNYSNIDSSA